MYLNRPFEPAFVQDLCSRSPGEVERVYVDVNLDVRDEALRLEMLRSALWEMRRLVEEGAAPMAPSVLRALYAGGGEMRENDTALLGAFQRVVSLGEGGRWGERSRIAGRAFEKGVPVEFRTLQSVPKEWSPSFLTPGGVWMRARGEAPKLPPSPLNPLRSGHSAKEERTRVYLGTPLGGATQERILENYLAALYVCRQISQGGDRAPLAPHLIYSLMMEERSAAERELGIHLDLALMTGFERLVLATPDGTSATLTSGMKADLERGAEISLPVEYRERPLAPEGWSPSALTPGGIWLKSATQVALERSREPLTLAPTTSLRRR